MLAEYIATICVETGRVKDKLRVSMFLAAEGFDKETFFLLLDKFHLKGRFDQWKLQ